MRVVVTGATGNVGSSVVSALAGELGVDEIVGVARRLPHGDTGIPTLSYVAADVSRDDLVPIFRGADAVIHLAWAIQPSRDRGALRATNVEGSRRVFAAARTAGVESLVYASSVGTYSPGPQQEGRHVDESWPTEGIGSSFYSVDKAEVESILDGFEGDMRIVRLRPALIFKRAAASEIRRLFAGPLVPNPLLEPSRLPVMPWIRGLRAQAVHCDDVADAYRRALVGDATGAFNIAADPVLDARSLAEGLDARVVELPGRAVRPLVTGSWRAHLQPTPPGWLDMARGVPLLDCTRARTELGWEPAHTATATLRELLSGIADRAGDDSLPPLERDAYDGARLAELWRGTPAR